VAGEILDEELSQLETEEDTFAIGEHEAREVYTFAEDTIAEYEALGITGRPRPILEEVHLGMFPDCEEGQYYDGRMPTVLKQLTLDEVSAMLSLSCNWHGYISGQHAIYFAQRAEAKKKKDSLWSIVRNNYRKMGRRHGVKYTDQKLSDFARQDKRFVVADAVYERLNVVYNTLSDLVDVTKKELDTISREVTIRQAKAEAEARGRGINNRVGNAGISAERRRSVGKTQDRSPAKVKGRLKVRGGKPA
jgi:hypothetical protein